MAKKYKLILLPALLGALSLTFFSRPVAVLGAPIRGLSLTPSINELTLNPGQNEISYRIRIDNNQSSPVTLQLSTLDFKSLNDTGGLAFIGSNASELQHKYGLAKWVDLPSSQITLPAGGGQFVNVIIENQTDLEPGGHYAAILFKQVNSTGSGAAARVQVNQVISSLLFVRKTGGEIYSLRLTRAHFNHSWLSWPSSVDLYFSNTGNTQTAPRGQVDLQGGHGQINPDSILVLPASTRVINTPITTSNKPIWPWYYHATITYRPDEGGNLKTARAGFIYINLSFLVFILIILACLAILASPKFPRVSKRLARWFHRYIW